MKKSAWYFIIALFVMTACKKSDQSDATPQAIFDTGKFNYYISEPIGFSNSSKNAAAYHWDFGDGQTSTETVPAHSYNNAGKYTITLTVNGSSTTKSTVRVFPGTESYVLVNSSSNALPFLTYGTDVLNNTGTYVSVGTIGNNAHSDTVYTFHSYVFVEGYTGGRYFYVNYPYSLTYNAHNILYYTNSTAITFF